MKSDFKKLTVVLQSVGAKTGKFEEMSKKAHFLVDCRGVLDPSHIGLGSGDIPEVQEWVIANNGPMIKSLKEVVIGAINVIPSRRNDKGDKMWDDPFIILCICAHGCHRSRAVKHILANWLIHEGKVQSDLPVSLSIEVE